MSYSLLFRLIKAVKKVGDQYPYYAPALARARFKRGGDNLKTMEISCHLVITYSESYVNKLTNDQLEKDVLHEILHYISDHHTRYMNSHFRKKLPHFIHNIAMDIEINEFIPGIAGGAFLAKNFGLPERKSYEEYLSILNREMPQKLKDLIKDTIKGDVVLVSSDENDEDDESGEVPSHLDMSDYSYEDNDIYAEILYALIEECEKNAGTESDSIGITRKLEKRKYPWEQVFQNIITKKTSEITSGYRYRSFVKVNRRYAHITQISDIIFPQYYDLKIDISLVIIMDISGSMGDNVNKMYEIMKSMIDILDMKIDITVLEVSAGVENIMHDFDLTRESIKSHDGGGTDMGAGLEYIYDNDMAPDLIVVMTDSYTSWPYPPILADKTVVLTDNPNVYDGPYPMFPVIF